MRCTWSVTTLGEALGESPTRFADGRLAVDSTQWSGPCHLNDDNAADGTDRAEPDQ